MAMGARSISESTVPLEVTYSETRLVSPILSRAKLKAVSAPISATSFTATVLRERRMASLMETRPR